MQTTKSKDRQNGFIGNMAEHLALLERHLSFKNYSTSDRDMSSEDTDLLLSVCSFLSYTVVVNTFFYKAPQVFAIVHSGSSMGISLTSVLLEWIAYTIMCTYHYAMEYPLETYLEIALSVFQDWLLTFVILVNRGMIKWNLIPYSLAYLLGFFAIALNWLPENLMMACIGLTTPILCWSKIDQLVEILWTQDPGSLSSLTWFVAVYDTGVRILTTLVITRDLPMLVNLASSEVLNVAIFASIIYYNFRKRAAKPMQLTQ